MNLQEELEGMLTAAVDASPTWSRLTEGKTKIEISGPLDEALQTIVSALMTYNDALLRMVMRTAEAVDELAESG